MSKSIIEFLKITFNVIRALVNSSDSVHWIKKYDASKKQYQELLLKYEKLEKDNLFLELELLSIKNKESED